jgi:undecaprenyl-phosphate 4-deoxy-4-formamido-L-arabinose transferase
MSALSISVVVPVYQGEQSLPGLVAELATLSKESVTASGVAFRVQEVLLVHDCGPDASASVIESLSTQYDFVRPIWLTRNFGQHAATLAGMASSTGQWVVTVDEDGQQAPRDISNILDAALRHNWQVVYAAPENAAPHSWLRNSTSRFAKAIASALIDGVKDVRFNSFRLIDGEIARTLAAYCGSNVYLDVGLSWIAGRIGHCPVTLRREAGRANGSGYNYWKLIGHFWRLVLTTGTKPLRLITLFGIFIVAISSFLMARVVYDRVVNGTTVEGWASLFVATSFFSGFILIALGIISEYLAVTMTISMGKPLYAIGSKPVRPAPRQ